MAREQITLQCTECKRKNYTSMKNKKTMTERLELKTEPVDEIATEMTAITRPSLVSGTKAALFAPVPAASLGLTRVEPLTS